MFFAIFTAKHIFKSHNLLAFRQSPLFLAKNYHLYSKNLHNYFLFISKKSKTMKNLKFLGLLLSIFVSGCFLFGDAPEPDPNRYRQFLEWEINGEKFYGDSSFTIGYIPVRARYSRGLGFEIEAENKARTSHFVLSSLEKIIDTVGIYGLDDTLFNTTFVNLSYKYKKGNYGYLRITRIDSVVISGKKKPILEGEFEFDGVYSFRNDTIKLRKGKFALSYGSF